MAVVSNLVKRTLKLPLSVSTNATLMASFLQQIMPLVYSDAYGSYQWFVNQYDLQTSQEFTVITWVMTSANDANFITNIMPGLLTQAGLSGIQTFTNTVSAGY